MPNWQPVSVPAREPQVVAQGRAMSEEGLVINVIEESPDLPLVLVHGAFCSECGEEMTAHWFSSGISLEWPVLCTERLARHPLVHDYFGPCKGRLLLQDVVRDA